MKKETRFTCISDSDNILTFSGSFRDTLESPKLGNIIKTGLNNKRTSINTSKFILNKFF